MNVGIGEIAGNSRLIFGGAYEKNIHYIVRDAFYLEFRN